MISVVYDHTFSKTRHPAHSAPLAQPHALRHSTTRQPKHVARLAGYAQHQGDGANCGTTRTAKKKIRATPKKITRSRHTLQRTGLNAAPATRPALLWIALLRVVALWVSFVVCGSFSVYFPVSSHGCASADDSHNPLRLARTIELRLLQRGGNKVAHRAVWRDGAVQLLLLHHADAQAGHFWVMCEREVFL